MSNATINPEPTDKGVVVFSRTQHKDLSEALSILTKEIESAGPVIHEAEARERLLQMFSDLADHSLEIVRSGEVQSHDRMVPTGASIWIEDRETAAGVLEVLGDLFLSKDAERAISLQLSPAMQNAIFYLLYAVREVMDSQGGQHA